MTAVPLSSTGVPMATEPGNNKPSRRSWHQATAWPWSSAGRSPRIRPTSICGSHGWSALGRDRPGLASSAWPTVAAVTVRRIVVDHVLLVVGDLAASRGFYQAALAPLGLQ